MPTPPAAAATQLRNGTATLTREATADVNLLPWDDADSITEMLHDTLPDLLGTYTEAAGAFAADWYDAFAGYEAQDFHALGRRFTAIPVDLGDAGAHALVGWAAETATSPETFHTLILGGLQRRIAAGARKTIMYSALADPAAEGWKRIASGATCDFCKMLASRGAVYSRDTADFHTHDHCNCIAVPELKQLPAGTPVPQPRAPELPADHPSLQAVRALTADELDAEMTRLMAENDFGDRFDEIEQRMDELDAERWAEEGIDLPEGAPAHQVAAYQDRLTELIEDWEVSRSNKTRKTTMQLREEYDAWAHTQWLSAENETRGNLLRREWRERPRSDRPDPARFFDGSMRPDQIRKYASQELLEWFAANPRLSFDEWRSMNGTNKSARVAQERVKYRTLSEYG